MAWQHSSRPCTALFLGMLCGALLQMTWFMEVTLW
eukprot:CAMPEP_0179161260 /NCGR_PEP_ID=MMETSP0796-20121207/78926_1 /TAXON_ID=73915 /ORGANISM="Pyrodinium bahamense, Strain pbaha01" /LENGTH=34 /DNA_ID= /DNA_START= /DNA_END= /DNA_ORIENTATION=